LPISFSILFNFSSGGVLLPALDRPLFGDFIFLDNDLGRDLAVGVYGGFFYCLTIVEVFNDD